jgi:hypothetical protein
LNGGAVALPRFAGLDQNEGAIITGGLDAGSQPAGIVLQAGNAFGSGAGNAAFTVGGGSGFANTTYVGMASNHPLQIFYGNMLTLDAQYSAGYVNGDSGIKKSALTDGNLSIIYDGGETFRFSTSTLAIASSTIIGGGVNAIASSTLHVVGTFQVNGTSTLTGQTNIDNLVLGATSFEADAGILTWTDLPVTTASAINTINGYSAQIDGIDLLSLYSESDGAGGIKNYGVAIGTSTATGIFSVGTTTGQYFTIASSTGYVGIGTTAPATMLVVNGTSTLYGALLPGASSTYSLGSPTMPWKDLYVGSSTIYIDNYPLTVVGGQLKFNGGSIGAGSPASTDWIANGSFLYSSTTYNRVGVGTISPSTTLHVVGTVQIGTGTTAFANAPLNMIGTVAGYLQTNIQNLSNATSASSDFIATADNGTDSTNYIDFGVNSSGYNQPAYSVVGPNDGYLYVNGGDLALGTQSASTDIIFHTAGTTSSDERMRITSTGAIRIAGAVNASSTLNVVGALTASSSMTVSGAVQLQSTAYVIGALRASSSLEVTGYTQLANASTTSLYNTGILNVLGTSYLNNVSSTNLYASANLAVGGSLITGSTTRINDVGYSWTGTQGAAGQVLKNDGSGNLTWQADSLGAQGTTGWIATGDYMNSTNTISKYAIGILGNTSLAAPGSTTLTVYGTSTMDILRLNMAGTDRLIVDNRGGLTINGSDNSIVRTTSGDFALGTVGANLDNSNGQIELGMGVVPNNGSGTITTAGQVTTPGVIGTGAFALNRPDGKYLIIAGGASTSMQIYDSVAGTVTASGTLNGVAGQGALALPAMNGRYRIISGASSVTTSLVDPMLGVAVGGATATALNSSASGTVAFKRTDGRYLVTNGGAGTTQIYDPVADNFVSGPALTAGTAQYGSTFIPASSSMALLLVATTTTQMYNQYSGAANIGVFTPGPVLPTNCEMTGTGSVVIRKPNGTYLVLGKASKYTIYDPGTNTFGSCNNTNIPTVVIGEGAFTIPMQNGTFLIFPGGGSTASYVYNANTDTFGLQGTGTASAIHAGGFALMRHDGKWQVFNGLNTINTTLVDTGLPMGGTTAEQYKTDTISTTALNAGSVLRWTAMREYPYWGRNSTSSVRFLVRTATSTGNLASATDHEILNSGDFIRPSSSVDTAIQVTINFSRAIPQHLIDERGSWQAMGQAVFPFDYTSPSLFDLMIDNATFLRRNNFDFTLPNADANTTSTLDASGPILTRAEGTTDRLFLPLGRLVASSTVSNTGFPQGVFNAAHASTTYSNGTSTIVIARPDRTFVLISRDTASTTNASIYDPAQQMFIPQSGSSIPTVAISDGAFSLKRPDGKFLVVMGGSRNTTNIYDPVTNTFIAGPSLSGLAGFGATAIPNADGTFTIVHGNGLTTSSLYDPVRMPTFTGVMSPGPTLTTAANCGFLAIPLKNGYYKIGPGYAPTAVGNTTAMSYDPRAKMFSAATATGGPFVATIACGATAFQRPDGFWIIMHGRSGIATGGYPPMRLSTIVNPTDGVTLAAAAPTHGFGDGGIIIPRPDGTFMAISGAGGNTSFASTTTQIYDPNASTFGVGATIGAWLPGPTIQNSTGIGAGGLAFQRPDGKFVIIAGNNTVTTMLYDAGWYADGQYLSEQLQVPALTASTTLDWKQAPDQYVRMEVRTATSQAGLATSSIVSVGRPGQSIYNAGGETWAQIEINFRRDFPSYTSLPDSYNGGTGGAVLPNRTIAIPTVFEFKLNGGQNLLDLQTNGLSMLRVTSNGNIYAAQQGGFYSGGADLAENYRSTQQLAPGEVVMIDPANPQGVIRAVGRYQKSILGVVSTAPGFVAGSYTPDSYPIGLIGRVPVKFTTENGSIRTGDFLTSASIPGYAMRATQSGRVIGTALESMNEEKLEDCPTAIPTAPTAKCGSLMVFVNLVDYQGMTVSMLMQEKKEALAAAGDTATVSTAGTTQELVICAPTETIDPVTGQRVVTDNNTNCTPAGISTDAVATSTLSQIELDHEQEVISFLKDYRKDNPGGALDSEIFTDRVNAALEIYAPKIVTAGLRVDSVNALNEAIAFNSDVIFFGQPYFMNDVGGFAVVLKDGREVTVTFEKVHIAKPVVQATMMFDSMATSTEEIEKQEELLFSSGIQYIITHASTTGFMIKLNKKAPTDVQFSWTALAVRDAKTFFSLKPKEESVANATTTPEIATSTASVVDVIIPPVINNQPVVIVPEPVATTTPSSTPALPADVSVVIIQPATSTPSSTPPVLPAVETGAATTTNPGTTTVQIIDNGGAVTSPASVPSSTTPTSPSAEPALLPTPVVEVPSEPIPAATPPSDTSGTPPAEGGS